MKEQTYLEDEDQLSDTDKLVAAIMAAGQDIKSGLYAVANAMTGTTCKPQGSSKACSATTSFKW
jgi:hypothetical protein